MQARHASHSARSACRGGLSAGRTQQPSAAAACLQRHPLRDAVALDGDGWRLCLAEGTRTGSRGLSLCNGRTAGRLGGRVSRSGAGELRRERCATVVDAFLLCAPARHAGHGVPHCRRRSGGMRALRPGVRCLCLILTHHPNRASRAAHAVTPRPSIFLVHTPHTIDLMSGSNIANRRKFQQGYAIANADWHILHAHVNTTKFKHDLPNANCATVQLCKANVRTPRVSSTNASHA